MVPTAANASYYAEIVSERAVLRRMVTAGTRIVQMGYAAEGDVHDLVDRAQAEVYDLTSGRTSEDYSPLRDIFDGTLNEIEAIASHGGQMVGVPTGFADLDALTNGLHPGQLVIIAARPAIGKSTLGLDLARSASIRNGLTSVIFSLEMARNEIVMRLMSAEAQVPLAHMRSGTMSDADWQKLARKSGAIVEAPMFIDDSPNMSMMEIRAKCRRLKQKHDLRLVIVDYLQLMSSGKKVGVPPAGGRGVLQGPEAAGQGTRGPGHRHRAAEPWPGAAPGQEADDERPARVAAPWSRTPTW